MTGVYSTDEPKYAYGGGNEGAMGDVTRNTVTIDLAHAADLVEEVYGGMVSAEDNTGAVDHNTANMKNGTTRLLYGGYTFGKGAVTNNEVHFEGGTSTGYVMGGYLDNTASTAEMTGNKVVFTNGTAAEIVGADSHGKGKLSGNTVTFGGAGSVAEILRGALAENQAAVEGNAGTITSVAPTGLNAAYGGEAKSASNVRNNHVIVEGTGSGTIANVFGGATGKADGTYETILRTDGDASDTAAVLLDVNRYKGGHVTTDQDADSDLYGGYSASDHTDAGQTIGHTTSGNTLSVTRIASRKNINAYGGYTGGTAGGTLDTYAKYFYTHQSGGSERLTTGETYDFDDVDSSRLRIGTRWTKKTLAGEFYTGLAYEYEFGSDARASYAGYGTPTPTLKGSTGLFELGYRFARPDSNVSYGVNLTGMMGKRRGITGSMQVNWAL